MVSRYALLKLGALIAALAMLVGDFGCQVAPSTSVPATRPTGSPTATAAEDLRRYVEAFGQVSSFTFAVEANHHVTFESKPQVWHYSGSGAYASPDWFRWRLQGQADVTVAVVSEGGQTQCEDTRGAVTADCSLFWGGPLPGSSPYAVIVYLREFGEVTASGVRSIQGKEYAYFAFVPDLGRVSALGGAAADQVAKLTGVECEVWVDKDTGLPRRETARIRAKSRGGQEEVVEVTIDFADYNRPVKAEVPDRAGG